MNWYAYKHFTRVDDWMFSSGMVTQDQIRAFDRDDPIRMSMMLVDLRLPGKESPSQSAKAKPIITITSSKDGHSISFEPDNINMNWSGGPSGSPHYPPTPWEGISWINLTAACGPLPDGEYALDVTWPGESDRPTLKANTSRFILGAVTLEQAAEFVHEKGEDNEIVKLKLTGESNATLFNGTDRA
ncbi:MAG TPA: hypothetical protein PK402_13615, partial [Tepidisphaeraceae bacterium]|nr:hypothetical protein [Tepidisphaeraceae bacterium]